MNSILEDIGGQKEAMIMLMDMNSSDFDLYNHSLNVCVYTLVLGVASGYTRQQLMEIGLGALLHDIGKRRFPLIFYISLHVSVMRNTRLFNSIPRMDIAFLRMNLGFRYWQPIVHYNIMSELMAVATLSV